MADTIRLLAALQTLLADNSTGDISPQDLRDFLVSAIPTGRTATKVVAATAATAKGQTDADYVCDGTADNVQIQAAIDALPTISAGSEGIVQLTEGTFTISAALDMTGDVWLKGSGRGATFIQMANSVNLSQMIKRSTASIAYHIHISDLTIDGNKANNATAGDGIDVLYMNGALIDNVRVVNCKSDGIFGDTAAAAEADGVRLQNVIVSSCDGNGIYIKDAAGWHLNNVSSGGNGGAGILLEGGGEHFLTDVELDGANAQGMDISTISRLHCSNLWVGDATNYGIRFFGTIIDCDFVGTIMNSNAGGVWFTSGVGYSYSRVRFMGLTLSNLSTGLRFDTTTTTYSGVEFSGVGTNTVTTIINTTPVPSGVVLGGRSAISDPGSAGAISVNFSGFVPIVTAGAETRTLAAPVFVGQELLLYCKTFVGNCVITCATTLNETGNNTITFSATGQAVKLYAVEEGSTLRWRLATADGAALSTV